MSSIETIAVNHLVFLENHVFLHFCDKQTDKQTDEHQRTKPLSLSRVSIVVVTRDKNGCCNDELARFTNEKRCCTLTYQSAINPK